MSDRAQHKRSEANYWQLAWRRRLQKAGATIVLCAIALAGIVLSPVGVLLLAGFLALLGLLLAIGIGLMAVGGLMNLLRALIGESANS